MRGTAILGCALLALGASSGAARASACVVVGDSIGVGIGQALKGTCSSDARVGLGSSAVAARVTPGSHWTIVSLGSNDFPRSINAAQRMRSEARVRAALTSVADKAGSRLILVLPANGARPLVASWASAKGVPTVTFTPGPDRIHPRSYQGLAHDIARITGQ